MTAVRQVFRWLGLGTSAGASASDIDAIRRIAAALDRMPPERARYLAAVAFVLSRVATADHEISAEELETMERLVMEHGDMPREQAVLVVQMARTQHLLFGATENFLVTRELGTLASHEEKLAIIDCLYAVAASDQRILTVEDNEIMRVAKELRVEHADVIARKRAYLAHLEVRKELGATPPASS